MALTGNKPIGGQPFHILGLDLLIDRELKAWILEVNDHPSLNIYHSKEYMGMRNYDEDICETDLYVKKRVVSDCINLCMKKTSTISEIDCLGSLTKILPNSSDEEASSLNACVHALRQLFYRLAPIKNKASINSGNFEKLVTSKPIADRDLKKYDLNLIFQQESQSQKQVYFLDFCFILLSLWTKKVRTETEDDFQGFVQNLLA
jgi:hypothetical protein